MSAPVAPDLPKLTEQCFGPPSSSPETSVYNPEVSALARIGCTRRARVPTHEPPFTQRRGQSTRGRLGFGSYLGRRFLCPPTNHRR